MKKMFSLAIGLVTLLLNACSSDGGSMESKVQYVPFCSEAGGRWGLIGPDGSALFQDKFKGTPSVAIHNRFVVEEEGGFAIYTAEENPARVGDKHFKEIGAFVEETTPAVEKGKGIVLVNVDGEIIADLTKLAGKVVETVTNFQERRAIFMTTDRRYGMINTTGEVVIQPTYLSLEPCSDGRIIALDEKFEQEIEAGETDKIILSVLNNNGKEIGLLPYRKFATTGTAFVNDRLAASNKNGEAGLVDQKGEWLVKPKKGITDIPEVRADHYIYAEGDRYGLCAQDGTTQIQARYARAHFMSDDRIAAAEPGQETLKMYDLKGQSLGSTTFSRFIPFFGGGQQALVQLGEKKWGFIGRGGERSSDEGVRIADADWNFGFPMITSDLLDTAVLLDHLQLTKDGFIGCSITMNPAALLDFVKQTHTPISLDAADNVSTRTINYTADPSCYFVWAGSVTFDQSIVTGRPNEETGKTVYMFNNEKPVAIRGILLPRVRLEEHVPALYAAVCEQIKTFGKEVKRTDNALVIDLGEGFSYFVENKKGSIGFAVLNTPAAEVNIETFSVIDSAAL